MFPRGADIHHDTNEVLLSYFKVRANDLKRIGEEITGAKAKGGKMDKEYLGSKYGWLCKTGLNNTKLQRRWCVIHGMKLYYYEGPRVRCCNC